MSKNKRPSGAAEIYSRFMGLFTPSGRVQMNPTMIETTLAVSMYRRIISELAINRFKWHNLPDTVNPRFLEMCLYRNALSVFYFDNDPKVNAFVALAGGPVGTPNMQDDPTAFRVYRKPLRQKTLVSNAECIPIWANTARTPDLDIVRYYSERFARWDTTLEINALNARQTKIVSSDENSRLTMANVNRQWVEGEPAIYVSDLANIQDKISVLDMGIDLIGLEKLSIVRSRIWSECMQYMGINAAATEKKERVVADEVSQNDDQVQSARNVALNSRKLAAYQINKRYGLNIHVEYNSDIDGQLNSLQSVSYVPGNNERSDEE